MPCTLAEYRVQYADADVLCQEVQNFRNEAGVPAINELRNAGHHLLKAVDDSGAVVSQDDLDAASAHARRASYEATEAGIMAAVALVKKFQEDYATIEVSDLVGDYARRCGRCNDALRLVERGRQPGAERSTDHADRITVFREIRPFAEELAIARIEANKRLAEKQRGSRQFILTTVLAVAAIVIGVAATAIFA